MRWCTAHRNRQRTLKRLTKRTSARKKLFDVSSLREWLDKLGPTFFQNRLYEESVFARILQNADRQRTHFGPISIPFRSLALKAEARRNTASVWLQIWESQNRQCAKCGQAVELDETAKRSHSFEVLCQSCAAKPALYVIVDDLDHPRRPEPLKTFIYGDSWNAYKLNKEQKNDNSGN